MKTTSEIKHFNNAIKEFSIDVETFNRVLKNLEKINKVKLWFSILKVNLILGKYIGTPGGKLPLQIRNSKVLQD